MVPSIKSKTVKNHCSKKIYNYKLSLVFFETKNKKFRKRKTCKHKAKNIHHVRALLLIYK